METKMNKLESTQKKKDRRPKRSGTIRMRESGLYQAIVRRRGQPAMSKTFFNKEDAERWARAAQVEIDRGSFVSSRRADVTTFKDLAEDFENDFAPHHYRGGAWRYKLAALRSRLDKYALTAITPQVVAQYRDSRLRDPDPRYKDKIKAPRVSGATVKTEIDLLAKLLDVGQKEFGIPLPAGNPVSGVRKPRGGQGRERRLTDKEWLRLERECRASGNTWLWPAVQLALETAMRQGELLSVEWKNVDRASRIAVLPDGKKIKNGEPRAVPLSSRAVAVLEELPRSVCGRAVPVERMTLYTAFCRACTRAGVTDYTWHDLRHEALSRLAERGDLTVLEMAAVSGHKTLQMLKRYTHIQASRLAEKLG